MTGANYERLCEKHKAILEKYKSNVPFYKKGVFKNALSVVLTAIWCYFWLEAALRHYSLLYVDFSFTNPRIYILPVILILLALYFFKPQRIFYDKTLCGTIEKISYKAGYTEKTGVKGAPASLKRQYRRTTAMTVHLGTAKITVKSPDGKTAKKTVFVHENFGDIYKEGQSVSMVCGENFPIPLDEKIVPEGKTLCTCCSSFEASSNTRCSMCRELLWNR